MVAPMKKIIPFRKEVLFKTNISEITSISLEQELSIDKLNISGTFMVSGDYKISDNSKTVEPFDLKIPFEIVLDEKYDTSHATCDIDDFYYEIVDNSILAVSIDVCIDKLTEILVEKPVVYDKEDIIEELFEEEVKEKKAEIIKDENKVEIVEDNDIKDAVILDRCIEEDDIIPGEEESFMEEKIEEVEEVKEEKKLESVNDKINSLFSNVGDGDIYVSYNVYIIRDGDTVESIMEKYGITEEELKKYNNTSDLKLGDKLIIPSK